MGTTALISGIPSVQEPPAQEAPVQEAPVSLPPNGFLSRDAQFAELDALLRRGRLVTLTGPPGAGKSRLLGEYLIRRGLGPSGVGGLGGGAGGAGGVGGLGGGGAGGRGPGAAPGR